MLNRKTLLVVGGVGVLVVALGLAGLWYFFLRDDAPDAVSLDAALTAVPGNGSAVSPAQLTGTWDVQTASSFAGYRVQENLAAFGSKTAVGRTTALQGSLSYDGKTISGVKVTADLTQLKSDQELRDQTIRMQSLQSCQFPNATFELTTPIALDSTPAIGVSVSKKVAGNLTLHGVTKPVMIDVKGQLQNGQVVIVGSTDIKFADYNMEQPRSLFVVSLDDHGIMEFQLIFAKAGASATPPVSTTPSPCSGGGFQPPPGGPRPGGGPGGPPPGGGFPPINTPGPVPSPVG